jgi:protein SCO1/2
VRSRSGVSSFSRPGFSIRPLTFILSPSLKERGKRRYVSVSPAKFARYFALCLIFIFALVRPGLALTPGELSRINFEQHPGRQISCDLVFRDENDQPFRLGDHFVNEPTILLLGYYRCPMLCTMINNGLIEALQNLRASVGRDFQVIDLSIDPTEKATAAAAKKALYLRRYGRSGAAEGWHCLVGDERSIAQVANEVGFRYQYDPETHEYAHPSGAVVLTPDGKISRYVFGVNFSAKELNDAVVAAKKGESGSVISQLFLLCYHYNPITGRYGALILSILRAASLGFVALIAWWVFSMARRSEKRVSEPG